MYHVEAIRTCAQQSSAELKFLQHLHNGSQSPQAKKRTSFFANTRLNEEHLRLVGVDVIVHRVFVNTKLTGKYRKVGWILTADVSRCMVCAHRFFLLDTKHHCHACGNVVCSNCSDDAVVNEISKCGPVNVGKCCFWGQSHVPCVPSPHTSPAFKKYLLGRMTTTRVVEPFTKSKERDSKEDAHRLLPLFPRTNIASASTETQQAHSPNPFAFSKDAKFSVLKAVAEPDASAPRKQYSSPAPASLPPKEDTVPRAVSADFVLLRAVSHWRRPQRPSVSTLSTTTSPPRTPFLVPDCPSGDSFDLPTQGPSSAGKDSALRAFHFADAAPKDIVGRPASSIAGQRLLKPDALVYRQDLCISNREAEALKKTSVLIKDILVGWQIAVLKKDSSFQGIGVITAARRTLLMQVEYRVSSDTDADCWLRLKVRGGKHGPGTEFRPLRKVLYQTTVFSLED